MNDFRIICRACSYDCKYDLLADYDTVQNCAVAKLVVTCQNCGRTDTVEANAPKRDLLPIDADPEVVEAIREAIG
jgi:RNase P subunit RPR2